MASFKEVMQEPSCYTESDFDLDPKLKIHETSSEVLSTRFSPDGTFIAGGYGDGSIRVYHASHGDHIHTYNYQLHGGLPTTCIRFRPHTSSNHTFLTSNANGVVQHWSMSSAKLLDSFSDKGNVVYALDFSDDGAQFATAGSDGVIRLYDESTKKLDLKLEGGILGDTSSQIPGHSNRVFSVKFTHDENLLLSGGWDNTVHIWDIRTGGAVRSLYGPHICGDSLDVKGNEILTGSWRSQNQLELWDLRSCERITEIPWGTGQSQFSTSSEPCMLYAAEFSNDSTGRFIAAGGSGANEAKVFDHTAGDSLVGTIPGFTEGVYSIDFSPDCEKIAIAGGGNSIRILDIVKKRKDEDEDEF